MQSIVQFAGGSWLDRKPIRAEWHAIFTATEGVDNRDT